MVAVEVAVMRVTVRCTGRLKDGRLCDHVIAKVDVDQWEEKRMAGVEVECRRCGALTRLATFV